MTIESDFLNAGTDNGIWELHPTNKSVFVLDEDSDPLRQLIINSIEDLQLDLQHHINDKMDEIARTLVDTIDVHMQSMFNYINKNTKDLIKEK